MFESEKKSCVRAGVTQRIASPLPSLPAAQRASWNKAQNHKQQMWQARGSSLWPCPSPVRRG